MIGDQRPIIVREKCGSLVEQPADDHSVDDDTGQGGAVHAPNMARLMLRSVRREMSPNPRSERRQ
jgi:hypothetical protein